MSGGSTPAGSTGREEIDECQEGVHQLRTHTPADSTGSEKLDECQD
jgi:hypothetical protein